MEKMWPEFQTELILLLESLSNSETEEIIGILMKYS